MQIVIVFLLFKIKNILSYNTLRGASLLSPVSLWHARGWHVEAVGLLEDIANKDSSSEAGMMQNGN